MTSLKKYDIITTALSTAESQNRSLWAQIPDGNE